MTVVVVVVVVVVVIVIVVGVSGGGVGVVCFVIQNFLIGSLACSIGQKFWRR